MSGRSKQAAVDCRTFSSRLIAFTNAYRHRFWGETGGGTEFMMIVRRPDCKNMRAEAHGARLRVQFFRARLQHLEQIPSGARLRARSAAP